MAVQVDPIKPALKAPGTKRLKLKCDEQLSNFAFKFNLRRCIEVMKTVMPLLATSTGVITHLMQPGAALETADTLCLVEVEDPSAVKLSRPFKGEFPRIERRKLTGTLRDDSALVRFNVNSTGIIQLLAGYDYNGRAVQLKPVKIMLKAPEALEIVL
jgi:hypothetical protein